MRKKERRVFFVSSPAVGVFFCVCLQVKKEKREKKRPAHHGSREEDGLEQQGGRTKQMRVGQPARVWRSPRSALSFCLKNKKEGKTFIAEDAKT